MTNADNFRSMKNEEKITKEKTNMVKKLSENDSRGEKIRERTLSDELPFQQEKERKLKEEKEKERAEKEYRERLEKNQRQFKAETQKYNKELEDSKRKKAKKKDDFDR